MKILSLEANFLEVLIDQKSWQTLSRYQNFELRLGSWLILKNKQSYLFGKIVDIQEVFDDNSSIKNDDGDGKVLDTILNSKMNNKNRQKKLFYRLGLSFDDITKNLYGFDFETAQLKPYIPYICPTNLVDLKTKSFYNLSEIDLDASMLQKNNSENAEEGYTGDFDENDKIESAKKVRNLGTKKEDFSKKKSDLDGQFLFIPTVQAGDSIDYGDQLGFLELSVGGIKKSGALDSSRTSGKKFNFWQTWTGPKAVIKEIRENYIDIQPSSDLGISGANLSSQNKKDLKLSWGNTQSHIHEKIKNPPQRLIKKMGEKGSQWTEKSTGSPASELVNNLSKISLTETRKNFQNIFEFEPKIYLNLTQQLNYRLGVGPQINKSSGKGGRSIFQSADITLKTTGWKAIDYLFPSFGRIFLKLEWDDANWEDINSEENTSQENANDPILDKSSTAKNYSTDSFSNSASAHSYQKPASNSTKNLELITEKGLDTREKEVNQYDNRYALGLESEQLKNLVEMDSFEEDAFVQKLENQQNSNIQNINNGDREYTNFGDKKFETQKTWQKDGENLNSESKNSSSLTNVNIANTDSRFTKLRKLMIDWILEVEEAIDSSLVLWVDSPLYKSQNIKIPSHWIKFFPKSPELGLEIIPKMVEVLENMGYSLVVINWTGLDFAGFALGSKVLEIIPVENTVDNQTKKILTTFPKKQSLNYQNSGYQNSNNQNLKDDSNIESWEALVNSGHAGGWDKNSKISESKLSDSLENQSSLNNSLSISFDSADKNRNSVANSSLNTNLNSSLSSNWSQTQLQTGFARTENRIGWLPDEENPRIMQNNYPKASYISLFYSFTKSEITTEKTWYLKINESWSDLDYLRHHIQNWQTNYNFQSSHSQKNSDFDNQNHNVEDLNDNFSYPSLDIPISSLIDSDDRLDNDKNQKDIFESEAGETQSLGQKIFVETWSPDKYIKNRKEVVQELSRRNLFFEKSAKIASDDLGPITALDRYHGNIKNLITKEKLDI